MAEQNPLELIEAAEVTRLSRKDQADAILKGTRHLHALMDTTVCPVILGLINPSEIEQAVAGTYYRITLLIRGLATLNDPAHFQIANSAARTVFELILDLKALCANPSLAARFFAFARVVRFRRAEQLVTFLNDNSSIDPTPHLQAINFASDSQRRQEVEQQCVQHWGKNSNNKPNWPTHWLGKNIADRAHDAGPEFEEMYRSQFVLQSQHVHAGLAGIQHLSPEALICSFGIAHRLVQRHAALATELVCDTFHLFATDLDLRKKLRRASLASAFYAVEAVLRNQDASDTEG